MTSALLQAAAAAVPERTALIWAPPGERPVRWTFARLAAAAERVAHRLAAEHAPGRALALQAPPDDAWLVVQHAAALAGLVLVVLPPRLPRRPAAALLRRAGADRLLDAAALRALLASDAPAQPLPDVPASAVAQVQLTSGTSTEPRGVMLSHATLAGQAYALAARLELSRADVVLNPNPLFHLSGQFFALAALARGAAHLLTPYEPAHVAALLEAERASVLGLPPALLERVLDHWSDRPAPPPALRLVALGGMRVAPELGARGEALWRVPLCTAYGLTEAGGLTHAAHPRDPVAARRRTVGRALDCVATRIVDPATGDEAPAGTWGEVQLRPAAPMTGYLGDPAATAAAFAAGGWLRTGDLGRLDDGFLTLAGRLDDRIIRAGATVSPEAVEAALLEHPQVAEAVAVGLPDAVAGERVAACVVAAPGTRPTTAQLRRHCAAVLPPAAVPDRIDLVETLARTALGKPRRAATRRQMLER